MRRFLRAFFARTRDSYSTALWFRLNEQLTEAKQALAETTAALSVAEAENKRLWLLSELHESRIERGLAIQHHATAQLRQAADIVNATRPEDLL